MKRLRIVIMILGRTSRMCELSACHNSGPCLGFKYLKTRSSTWEKGLYLASCNENYYQSQNDHFCIPIYVQIMFGFKKETHGLQRWLKFKSEQAALSCYTPTNPPKPEHCSNLEDSDGTKNWCSLKWSIRYWFFRNIYHQNIFGSRFWWFVWVVTITGKMLYLTW